MTPDGSLLHPAGGLPDFLPAADIGPGKQYFSSLRYDSLRNRRRLVIDLTPEIQQDRKHGDHARRQQRPESADREGRCVCVQLRVLLRGIVMRVVRGIRQRFSHPDTCEIYVDSFFSRKKKGAVAPFSPIGSKPQFDQRSQCRVSATGSLVTGPKFPSG